MVRFFEAASDVVILLPEFLHHNHERSYLCINEFSPFC
jgi:hypothetical protein